MMKSLQYRLCLDIAVYTLVEPTKKDISTTFWGKCFRIDLSFEGDLIPFEHHGGRVA